MRRVGQLLTCVYPDCGYPIHEALDGFWVHFRWPFHVIDHVARHP